MPTAVPYGAGPVPLGATRVVVDGTHHGCDLLSAVGRAVRVQLVSLVDEELLGQSAVTSKRHIVHLGQRAHLQAMPAPNQQYKVHWGCHARHIIHQSQQVIDNHDYVVCCLTAPLYCSLSSVPPRQLPGVSSQL